MRNRVVCYITRDKRDLLIFRRSDWTRPGVVAGGVEEGETLTQAALRETFEEAGLVLQNPVYLGSYLRELEPEYQNPHRIWHQHYFWLETPLSTPDQWIHKVSAGEEDKGMIHQLSFVPIHQHGLGHTLEALIPQLQERL